MTKDECLKALDNLDVGNCWVCDFTLECGDNECVARDKLRKLIEEHFKDKPDDNSKEDKNPPLEYDELEDGMIVWDSKIEDYIELKHCINNQWMFYRFGLDKIFELEFSKNRYYREEVEECES